MGRSPLLACTMLRPDAPTFAPSARSKGPSNQRNPSTPKQKNKNKKPQLPNSPKQRGGNARLQRQGSSGGASKSKKSNQTYHDDLNDQLLNFSFAPVDHTPSARGPLKWPGRKISQQGYHERAKDVKRFLNSRFRFTLLPSAAKELSAREELNVQKDESWKHVAYVGYIAEPDTRCSICLDALIAPQVTKCGHLFCMPCLMRYYHVATETNWAKCPVCFHTVDRREIKPVDIAEQQPVEEGKQCQLQLLKYSARPPWIATSPGEPHPSGPLSSDHTDARFSKQVFASAHSCEQLRTHFVDQLEQALNFEDDTASRQFIEIATQVAATMWDAAPAAAMDAAADVDAEMLHAEADDDQVDVEEQPMIPASLLFKSRHHTNCTAVSSENAAAAEGFSEADMASALAASEAEQSHQPEEDPDAPAPDSYFYQLADGQPAFLLPLNVRMLEAQFGSLSEAPHMLLATVMQTDTFSSTIKLCSQHVSLSACTVGSEVVFIELDLKDVVNKATMEQFSAELKQRAKKRKANCKKNKAAGTEMNRSVSADGQPGELHKELMRIHGGRLAVQAEEVPDMEALSSFPQLENESPLLAPHSPGQSRKTPKDSPSLGSFSNVAEHGFAAASFLLEDMPDLNGEFALTAQYEQQAAAGVWGGAPAAASSGWSNGTSLSRAASWPSSAINPSDREVEAGDVAPPSLSDFLTFKGKTKQDKKKGKKGKKNQSKHSMRDFDH